MGTNVRNFITNYFKNNLNTTVDNSNNYKFYGTVDENLIDVTNIDQLKNIKVKFKSFQKIDGDVISPQNGEVWFNTQTGELKRYYFDEETSTFITQVIG